MEFVSNKKNSSINLEIKKIQSKEDYGAFIPILSPPI